MEPNYIHPFLYVHNFHSLFTTHPHIQEQFFPLMSASDVEVVGKHGKRVMRDVGGMVHLLGGNKDDELVSKIRQVCGLPLTFS